MPSIQQSTTPATALTKAKYERDFTDAGMARRLYDQFAVAVDETGQVEQGDFLGTSYYKHYLSELPPTTDVISQTSDIVPKTLVDASSSISPSSRADAIQWAEAVELYSYSDWGVAATKRVGEAAMKTLEWMAIDTALTGEMVIRNSARASLDHDTAGDLFTEAAIFKAYSILPGLQAPPFMGNGRPQWLALYHSDLDYDLIENDNVKSVALYQDKEILFKGEVGQIHNVKLLADAQAKIFLSAGADGDSNVATTLNGATEQLATSLTATAGTNITANMWLTVGTEETANTFYHLNERIRTKATYTAGSTAVTFIGWGADDGMKWAHASGAALRNGDNVYPVLYGAPGSLVKMYSKRKGFGPFAKMVGPIVGGLAEQFTSLAYKWHGGYGLPTQRSILRGEYAATLGAATY